MKVYPIVGHTALFLAFLCPFFTSAQTTNQVYINEINYRAIEPLENIDFVEIYNAGTQTVNLNGWFLTGGLDYTFPNGSSIAPGAYLVIAADPALAQSHFGISNVLGPWDGKLSSSEDKVVLRTSNYEVIDRVEYENWKEWPNVRYLDTPIDKVAVSIQKLNPLLPGNQPGSWMGGVPTPKTQNSGVYQAVATDIPVLKDVKKSPDKPTSSDDVIIRADFAGAENYASGMTVTLEYQTNNAGSYVAKSEMGSATWQSTPMLDDGMNADSTANNGLYTAKLSSNIQVDRRLVRYRIKVTKNGISRYFPDQNNRESNYSYFVYNGHANFGGYNFANIDTINEFTVITNDAIPTSKETGEYVYEATLIYNGKIYDHITFRGRGRGSLPLRPKPNLKFKFNSEKKLTLEDDCGNDYDIQKSKISLSGGYVNDPAGHGFTETFIYKILDLTGALPRHTDYTQLRIIDSATEEGVGGDFWGLYLMLEDYNSEDYFEENGITTGNIWGHKPDENKHYGDFPYAESIGPSTDTGPFDWDLVYSDRVANVIYGQYASNYFGKHSHVDYYNSETGLWHTWWSDMDNAFGSPIDDDNWMFRTSANVNTTCRNALIPNAIQGGDTIEYKNELRSAYDLLLNNEQSDFLVDMESKEIFDPNQTASWTDLNDARWGTLLTNYYVNNNMENQLQWYKDWLSDRAAVILGRNGDGLLDPHIPNKPTISNTGTMALNNIKFSNSPFFDPQGGITFEALEWRVGEWSDPSNPYYDTKCKPKYEIETKWSSGEITTYSNTFQIPPEANLKEGRTYKIRVRYKDNSGRWSHWSNPQVVVPTAAPPVSSNLVINEIMYNPAERYTEFIEIHNTGGTTVLLDNVKMTSGVDYDFPAGSSILSDEYIILAEDSIEFYNIHGFHPFGEYKSNLSNGEEYLELTGPYRVVLDSLTYGDDSPWPSVADNGFYSLAFKEELTDNSIAANWSIQSVIQTPGEKNEFNNLGVHGYTGIVINEIHYNPADSITPLGDVISGRKFEFVEIKNISSSTINLSGAYFTQGIEYYFPSGTYVGPGQFIVLAEDKSSFEDRYNFAPFDKYDDKLSNSGEALWLFNNDDELLDAVTYSADFPWDSGADLSIALIDGDYNNETRLNWKTQCSPTSWTPGAENDFSCFNGLQYDGLVINEIHYNPSGGSGLEYIEIMNSSNTPLNLEEINLSSAVTFTFEPQFLAGAIASPYNYIVIANNATAYYNEYQKLPDGEYNGSLANFGATIVLQDLFGETIDEVTYDDNLPWDPQADQGSYSLALLDPALDNSLAESWCIQDPAVKLTPDDVNVFEDSDSDSIVDCLDDCPSFDNDLIGAPCDDNNPCTTGEKWDDNCACSDGVFQDSDADGICDANDACPGFDDSIDVNNNGIPDACEPTECDNYISEMNYPLILSDAGANINITTNGKVANSRDIEYRAGNNIDLMPGFEVELGSIYHAYIQPCN